MKHFVSLFFITFLFSLSVLQEGKAQTFLNGDFEINTAGFDQINIGNAAFNGFMSNTIAYGTFGDMDIISSATYCGLAQNGLWYTALTGSGTDAITMQLSAPLVAGTSYTMSFWDRGCVAFSSSTLPVQIGVSMTAGTTGTPVFTGPTPTSGTWVNRTFTFVAPVSGQFISALMPSGGLSDWTQIDNFTFITTTPTPPVVNFSTSDNSICEGTCTSFTDLTTNSPTTWSWSFPGGTPATSSVQNPSSVCYAAAGTYAVTLTATNASGSNSLTQTSFITVTANDAATISYSSPSFCQSGVNPSPTISGTTGGVFSSTAGLSITAGTGTINLVSSTAGTYTVTYTTTGACPTTATTTVTISTPSLATFNYGGPYCQNAADPSPTLGAGASAGTFTSSAGLSINPATGVVDLSLSAPGSYTVTNSVAASGACPPSTATASITIEPVPVPLITGTTNICAGASTTLTASGGASYVWNTGPTTAAITLSPSSTTTYTVTANNGGCTATTTQTVTVIPPVTSSASATICQGNSYTLPSGTVVSTAGTYSSTLSTTSGCDSVVSTTLTVTPAPTTPVSATICQGGSYTLPSGIIVSTAGVYSSTVTTAGGCDSIVSTTLSVTPPPVSLISPTICAGQTYTLPSGLAVSTAGLYSDTVSTSGGCDSVITVNLSVNSPVVNAGPDQIIDYGDSTIIFASGGITYSWSPTTGLSNTTGSSTLAEPTETTTYTVTATTSSGCTASDEVTVFVKLPPCEGSSIDLKTLIPNAFSPNDDGLNDQFCIPENPCITKLEIMIFDRWGEKVYEGNMDECWDGVYKGKKLDSAVFAYFYTVTFINGTSGKGQGNISLIK